VSTGTTLRLATWNVHGLRGGVAAVARVVREEAIDVLLLQESGARRRLRGLGTELGWIVCADPPAFPRRRIQNAVLLRPSQAASVSSRLVRFEGDSLLSPRGALLAETGDGWTVVSVHLGLRAPERGRHVEQLAEMLEGTSGRFVIGADLNALPEDPGPAAVARWATDCWAAVGEGDGATFPSLEPTARIDYLFVGPAIRPHRTWTVTSTISDHLMVVAEVEMDR
jgi:endonuclease/exonuclease/phosphatase family metal-dependent hydrolase